MTIGDFLDDAAHHIDVRCCDDCNDVVEASTLKDPNNSGEDLCKTCVEGYYERQAELLDAADAADYYGGECAAEVYERASMRHGIGRVVS